MNIYMTLFAALLFFLLTPGVATVLPGTDSPLMTVALVHAAIFALVWHCTKKMMWNATKNL